MRLVSLIACAAFVVLSGSSAALAQSCGKGMLWPHVRQPGDCLTEEEIKAGQTGVYSGPVNTNPDVSTIKPTPETQNVDSGGGGFFSGNIFGGGDSPASTAATCSKGLLWPFVREEGDCPTQIERRQAAAAGRPITVAAPAPPPPPETAPTPEEARCERSWLWPFVRQPGDCQTDAEKK